MFISIVEEIWAIWEDYIAVDEFRNNAFANSLRDTTVQDGSTREIGGVTHWTLYLSRSDFTLKYIPDTKIRRADSLSKKLD